MKKVNYTKFLAIKLIVLICCNINLLGTPPKTAMPSFILKHIIEKYSKNKKASLVVFVNNFGLHQGQTNALFNHSLVKKIILVAPWYIVYQTELFAKFRKKDCKIWLGLDLNNGDLLAIKKSLKIPDFSGVLFYTSLDLKNSFYQIIPLIKTPIAFAYPGILQEDNYISVNHRLEPWHNLEEQLNEINNKLKKGESIVLHVDITLWNKIAEWLKRQKKYLKTL